MSRIGEKIREERLKQGLTSKQLGKKCGVSESYIIEIETGKKIINEKLLTQLSKIFGRSLEENLIQEPKDEEVKEKPITKPVNVAARIRQEIEPVGQWKEALSGIIKKVPVFDINMREVKEYRSFPIVERKVEGFNPDKLVYIEVPDDQLNGFRIHKGDRILIYLNQEPINNSLVLVEYDGKARLRKLKKQAANKIELITFYREMKSDILDPKSMKILGRGIRLEVDLKTI